MQEAKRFFVFIFFRGLNLQKKDVGSVRLTGRKKRPFLIKWVGVKMFRFFYMIYMSQKLEVSFAEYTANNIVHICHLKRKDE